MAVSNKRIRVSLPRGDVCGLRSAVACSHHQVGERQDLTHPRRPSEPAKSHHSKPRCSHLRPANCMANLAQRGGRKTCSGARAFQSKKNQRAPIEFRTTYEILNLQCVREGAQYSPPNRHSRARPINQLCLPTPT